MPQYEMIGELMYFRALDAFAEGGVLTIGWRITDRPEDPWTGRFNAVKARDARAIRAAKTVAGAAVTGMTFMGARPGIIVGAVSSSKEQLEPADPVWHVGAAVAETQVLACLGSDEEEVRWASVRR